jgi:hypothetical protein
MLTARFARQVVAPPAAGQPGWVAWIVLHGARAIGAHAVAADLVFALDQLAIGLGLLVPRTVRPAFAVSVLWPAGIWVVGEGLDRIAGGTASFLTGAPGAALLYGLLAVAAWPRKRPGARPPGRGLDGDRPGGDRLGGGRRCRPAGKRDRHRPEHRPAAGARRTGAAGHPRSRSAPIAARRRPLRVRVIP